jgi:hypothetical protein
MNSIGIPLIQQTNAELNVTYSITILTSLSSNAFHSIVLNMGKNFNSIEIFQNGRILDLS